MASKLFISYRREDAKWQAREIYRALTHVLPPAHVFMDIDSIPPGADFIDFLERWVEQCDDILLALIGPGWTDSIDPKTGRRRLESPHDFVRIKVRRALERGIPVVPVLLDGATIPDGEGLPDDLRKLVRRSAEFIEHRTVDTDVERLIKRLGLARAPHQTTTPPSDTTPPAPLQNDRMLLVDAVITHNSDGKWFLPGAGKSQWFKDHEAGPEMVVVPAGSFTMGSPGNEPERESWRAGTESPQHKVTIAQPFGVARHAITRGQFAAFVSATGHKTEGGAYIVKGYKWEHDPKASWRAPGFVQDDSHPVVCINWDDAKTYAAWLSQTTGKPYRLLSEAEREYVTRAGTTAPFWWGSSITPDRANYDATFVYEGGGSKGEYRKSTVPVGSFKANPWGLYNLHGNVWEWCEDVWHDNYSGAPVDGSAWLQGGDEGWRVVRGGSWYNDPQILRAADRFRSSTDLRDYVVGFRLARTLSP
jgi:formylglycine-generating enzyme required for sulfatase activity